MNKENRIKRFKALTSNERKELIRMKMKANGIELGSGVPDKKYENTEVSELINILNYFPELRDKSN